MTFTKFGLLPALAQGVRSAGFEKPTPIQSEAIPVALAGRDLIGIAQTGTGKTAAFALPVLQRLAAKKQAGPRALVIGPTRELAEQTQDTFTALGAHMNLRSTTIYGGVGMNGQIQTLKRGVDIVVACPGRLLDHLQQRTINLDAVEVLVLDEADQMLDMGFLPSIEKILKYLPRERQTMLFSATMPDAIRKLAGKVLQNPETVQIGHVAPAHTVAHAVYPVAPHQKGALLLDYLEKTPSDSVLVFMRTKHAAKKMALKLEKIGYTAAALQGNLSQNKRQEAIDGFRNGKYKVLVATDIAARGIDVSRVSHVINYDIPDTPETYTHRIGRTGRAERNGEAVSFITHEDEYQVRAIERLIGKRLDRKKLDGFDYNSPPPPASERPQGREIDYSRRKTPAAKAQQQRQGQRNRRRNSA